MSAYIVQWGILSTARIASKFCNAVNEVPTATVSAVASRDAQRAQEWASKHGIERAYGSYEELLQDPEIDAVYIPIPTHLRKELLLEYSPGRGLHAQWVLRAAAARKHILCEKPCAVSLEDLQEMITACEDSNVMFMDGVMFTHHDRLMYMREAIDLNGGARSVSTEFSFKGSDEFFANDIRTRAALEPLGALGDLGWYNIMFSLWAFDWKMPSQVLGVCVKKNEEGVPISFTGVLYFDGGESATFQCAFDRHFTQHAVVTCEDATISLDDFTIASDPKRVSFTKVEKAAVSKDSSHVHEQRSVVEVLGCRQEAMLVKDFCDIVRSGTVDKTWRSRSLAVQQIVDALLQSADSESRLVSVSPMPALS